MQHSLYVTLGKILWRVGRRKQTKGWELLKTTLPQSDTWVVVGNGPSLTAEQLDSLSHFPSIASNKIGLIFDQTAWRPTIFSIADPLLIFKMERDDLDGYPLVVCPRSVFFSVNHRKKLAWRAISLRSARQKLAFRELSVDPLKDGFYGGKTITIFNIQLAMWAGAKRIYLLGCDHNYVEPQYAGVKKIPHGEVSNHFDPNYRKQNEVVNNAPVARMNEAYAFTRLLADACEVEIINLTPGTKLTAFELGDFESAVLGDGLS